MKSMISIYKPVLTRETIAASLAHKTHKSSSSCNQLYLERNLFYGGDVVSRIHTDAECSAIGKSIQEKIQRYYQFDYVQKDINKSLTHNLTPVPVYSKLSRGTVGCYCTARYFSTTKPDKMASKYENDQPNVISLDEARRFMIDCFLAAHVPDKHAQAQANLLLAADYRGHFSHGMNRLEMYINDLLINSTAGGAVPVILKETPATAWVDGKNGLGAVVGEFCMDLAIKKAKTVGVGWVCAKRSNHYGIAGYYTLRAEKEGLVGLSMTNTSPLMSPTRSVDAALGTNPISLAAPANDGDSFVLDMATTAVAVGKIEIQRRKELPIPEGWAQDPNGNITTDAELAFKTGCLMPVGGAEVTSGYKGYGLGAMVEILCGISAGSHYGPHVRKWTHAGADSEADLGQVFIAVDPNCFAPGFTDRMSDLNDHLRQMKPADPSKPVLVPGDPERIREATVDKEGGLRYHPNQIKTCHSLAERLKIKPIQFLNDNNN